LLLSSWLILNTINPQLTNLAEPDLQEITEELEFEALDEPKNPPCEFAEIYNEVGWQDHCTDIWIPANKTESGFIKQCSIRSYVFYRRRQLTKAPCPEGDLPPNTKCVDGFLLEPCDPEIEHCTTKRGVDYKEGGACVLEIYKDTTWWIFIVEKCGDKLNNPGGASVENLEPLIPHPVEDIECIKLIQIKR
jgi:hypothetical protein